uniref:Uncharacterized protein n=1 Tax=Cucumis melo TaxID=3656 RepID=A0A9I9DKE2_CUCME
MRFTNEEGDDVGRTCRGLEFVWTRSDWSESPLESRGLRSDVCGPPSEGRGSPSKARRGCRLKPVTCGDAVCRSLCV